MSARWARPPRGPMRLLARTPRAQERGEVCGVARFPRAAPRIGCGRVPLRLRNRSGRAPARRRRGRAGGRPVARWTDLCVAARTCTIARWRARRGAAWARRDADRGVDRAARRRGRGHRDSAREDQADPRRGPVGRRASRRTHAVRALDQRVLRVSDRDDACVNPSRRGAQGDRARGAHACRSCACAGGGSQDRDREDHEAPAARARCPRDLAAADRDRGSRRSRGLLVGRAVEAVDRVGPSRRHEEDIVRGELHRACRQHRARARADGRAIRRNCRDFPRFRPVRAAPRLRRDGLGQDGDLHSSP